MYLLEHGPGSRNGKRYNRHGVANVDAITTSKGKGEKKFAAGAAGGGLSAAAVTALSGDSGLSAGNSAAS
jgi:hypothetical protein